MSIKIRIKKHKNIPVVKIDGDMVGSSSGMLSSKFESLIGDNAPVVAVDMSGTSSLDSSALGVFVFAWKQLTAKNRKLVFVCPQGFVRSLFESTNLGKVFPIVDSVEEL
jgi:anti-anti-sigma factor